MFTPDERKTFRYDPGTGQPVHGDPLAIHYGLLEATDGELSAVVEDARSQDVRTRVLAQRRLAEAVRAAFEMAPFDRTTGAGATMQDCLDACWAFLSYLSQKKTPPASSPTSAPPTGVAFSPAGRSATKPLSACG